MISVMCECECAFVSFPSCKLYFASTASLHNLLTIEWSTMKDTTLYVHQRIYEPKSFSMEFSIFKGNSGHTKKRTNKWIEFY